MPRALCAFLLLFGMSWPTAADDGKPLTAIPLIIRAELPEVKPADKWTYVFSELPRRRVVTEFSQEVSKVDATSIVVNMRRGDGKPDEIKYGRDWLQAGDFRVYEFPLELGKTWSYTRSYNSC